MALVTRKIKRQIQSIKNTQKITKAMELVSAAKMRKAVNAVLATRPYANLAWQVISNLASRTNPELHPLLHQRKKIKKIGVILFSSNRGLCGIFNQQIIRKTLSFVKNESSANTAVEFITLGKKGATAIAKLGQNISADFAKPDIISSVTEIRAVALLAIQDYLAGKYDKVVLIYTDFISSLKQEAQIKQLLPLKADSESGLGQVGPQKASESQIQANWTYQYLFEPTPNFILKTFLPRLIEIQIYQAILESNASEHSARMVAMKNASEAASDLIADLTLTFNKARQAGITQEISEISVSKAALEE